jgi:hypothetical protein
MPGPTVGRRRDQRSWLDNVVLRARLVQAARGAYSDFRYRRERRPGRGVTYTFSAMVPLEGFEPRHVTIVFSASHPTIPVVLADGPDDSPHRYAFGRGRRRLCLWFPGDPPERRWVPEDGLLHLFGIATMHLIKEAWWREAGKWAGEEYPHDEDQPKGPDQAA